MRVHLEKRLHAPGLYRMNRSALAIHIGQLPFNPHEMAIQVRRPQLEDLDRLTDIYNYAVRETTATYDTEEQTSERFQPFLTVNHSHRMLVAEVDGEIVAYAGTSPFSPRGGYRELGAVMIYVHPAWQKRRIGPALLQEIHQLDFLKGLYTLVALIDSENTKARRLFESFGYVVRGEMVDAGLKFGTRRSVAIYQRDVNPKPAQDDAESTPVTTAGR